VPVRTHTKMLILPLVALASAAGAEPAATGSFHLRVQVPVACTVEHQAAVTPAGAGFRLGNLHEFCNAPQGYSLVVNYAPGSLKGAMIAVGNERITLDGSGRGVVSRSQGPRVRDREVYAQPGAGGFDTDKLDFHLEAS
jgi:hypothetical protein